MKNSILILVISLTINALAIAEAKTASLSPCEKMAVKSAIQFLNGTPKSDSCSFTGIDEITVDPETSVDYQVTALCEQADNQSVAVHVEYYEAYGKKSCRIISIE